MKRLCLFICLLGTVLLAACSAVDASLADKRAESAIPDGWVTHSDEDSGLSFAYPADWTLEAIDPASAGMPDDWPVVAGWLLMPPDVAAALAERGEPDPNAPVIVPPFNIEVVSGDRAALERVYPVTESERVAYGGHEAIVARMEPGYSHFIFAHSSRPLWVVVTDWVSDFPDREAQAKTAAPVLEPLLLSLRFDE